MMARCLPGLSPSALSRLRSRLRRDGVVESAPRLRRRATTLLLRADPDDLPHIAGEPRVVWTGISAADEHGLDVTDRSVLEAYVSEEDVNRLIDAFFLEPSARPNLILRAVPGPWPFPDDTRIAPRVVAALDLAESDDARARRAGLEVLECLGSA